jgi:hypothetical protein
MLGVAAARRHTAEAIVTAAAGLIATAPGSVAERLLSQAVYCFASPGLRSLRLHADMPILVNLACAPTHERLAYRAA